MSLPKALKNKEKENYFVPIEGSLKGNTVLDITPISQIEKRNSLTSDENEFMDEKLIFQKIIFQRERKIRTLWRISVFPCL